MSFSERQGLKPIRQVLQIDSIDTELRNRLWNILSDSFPNYEKGYTFSHPKNVYFLSFCRKLWHEYFKQATDLIPLTPELALNQIRKYFFTCEWFEVYDLLEFIVPSSHNLAFTTETINKVLASELSAYRFVDGKLAPISSELEKQSIETAIARTVGGYSMASEHLQQAVTLLARKPAPDYRNSIKEAISAVEAVCAIITGNPKATLGQALKVIEPEAPL